MTPEEKHERRQARALRVLRDLDRCPHGRHRTDRCFDCQKEGHEFNQGNPYLFDGLRLGSNYGGLPIIWPDIMMWVEGADDEA